MRPPAGLDGLVGEWGRPLTRSRPTESEHHHEQGPEQVQVFGIQDRRKNGKARPWIVRWKVEGASTSGRSVSGRRRTVAGRSSPKRSRPASRPVGGLACPSRGLRVRRRDR